MMRHPLFLLSLILLVAALFRLTGVNWDQNQHLHPDERFLTMVSLAIHAPTNLKHYLDTNSSPANPNNVGYDFYVYGTLPLYVVKSIATFLKMDDYVNLTLVGRVISALIDTLSVAMIYFISRRLNRSEKEGLLASGVYALMALPIQLAHFYAVDPYVVLFTLLSVYFALSLPSSPVAAVLSGFTFSLALSAKISAVILSPIILLCFMLVTKRNLKKLFIAGLLFLAAAGLTLRFSSPYTFIGGLIPQSINPKFTAAIQQLRSFDNSDGWFPPSVQWLHITKGIFPLENLLLWGLGLPLGVISVVGLIFCLKRLRREPLLLIPLAAILLIFGYQSRQFAQPMRYFYPLLPFLAITTGIVLLKILTQTPIAIRYLIATILLIWPIACLSIYLHPHSRVAATDWAWKNIPPGSVISCELWDDCVPLNGTPRYRFVDMPLYDPDSPQKWTLITSRLSQLDYLVLSSNRLYGSITSAPDKYPQASQWYQDLFAGRLGFIKVAEFTSRPHIPLPGIALCLTPPHIHYGQVASTPDCKQTGIFFVDDYADETWTVYDHPKVTIFKKTGLPVSAPSALPK